MYVDYVNSEKSALEASCSSDFVQKNMFAQDFTVKASTITFWVKKVISVFITSDLKVISFMKISFLV